MLCHMKWAQDLHHLLGSRLKYGSTVAKDSLWIFLHEALLGRAMDPGTDPHL